MDLVMDKYSSILISSTFFGKIKGGVVWWQDGGSFLEIKESEQKVESYRLEEQIK